MVYGAGYGIRDTGCWILHLDAGYGNAVNISGQVYEMMPQAKKDMVYGAGYEMRDMTTL